MNVPIVYCVDDIQKELVINSINSLVINSQFDLNVYVFVPSESLKEEFSNRIRYNERLKLKIKLIGRTQLDGYMPSFESEHSYLFSYMNAARFLIPTILPFKWIIYIDSDTIIQGDILDITAKIDNNRYLYAKPDLEISNYVNEIFLNDLQIEPDYVSFNAGVYLMDLDYWRYNKLGKHVKCLIRLNNENNGKLFKFFTQPILNILYHGKYGSLCDSWNVKDLGWNNHLNADDLNEANILHFNGPNKPSLPGNQYEKYWSIYSNRKSYGSRINENGINPSGDILFTTYFTSKPNPQRGILSSASDPSSIVKQVEPNSEDLTKVLFDSVSKLNLKLVVFHDGLSEQFINEFSSENIEFLASTIKNYSTNDERFFVYKEYLDANDKIERVFFIDCFDVKCVTDPFKIFEEYGDRLYVGRDCCYSIENSPYLMEKLANMNDLICSRETKESFQNFLRMPLFNAGIVGGSRQKVMFLLDFMCNLFACADRDDNNNMIILNYAIFKLYMRHTNFPLSQNPDVIPMVDPYSKNDNVYSGFPLNSLFKSYEDRDDVYFIHK